MKRIEVFSALRRLRLQRNFRQWDLALLTGIPQSWISLLEHGFVMPNPGQAKIINQVLGEQIFEEAVSGGGMETGSTCI